MKIHISIEQDLAQLNKQIDLYDAGNHYPPRLYCSEETKLMLDKYRHDESVILDTYYICHVIIDNNIPFGDVEIKEF